MKGAFVLLLLPDMAAKLLGISVRQVKGFCREGLLPAVRLPSDQFGIPRMYLLALKAFLQGRHATEHAMRSFANSKDGKFHISQAKRRLRDAIAEAASASADRPFLKILEASRATGLPEFNLRKWMTCKGPPNSPRLVDPEELVATVCIWEDKPPTA